MLLFHTTTSEAFRSIRKTCLKASKSKGKRKAVWLHVEKSTSWALQHVLSRHQGRVDRLVRLCVHVPSKWLKRHSNGIYYCECDIPVERIVSVTTFEQVTRPFLKVRD